MLERSVLLYDGDCRFCQRWVAWLRRQDRDELIRPVPSVERQGVPGLPVLSDDALDRAMHLVMPDGRVLAGAAAVPAILTNLPRWHWVGHLFRIPGVTWVAERIYSQIARRRHRLGCGSSRCRIGSNGGDSHR